MKQETKDFENDFRAEVNGFLKANPKMTMGKLGKAVDYTNIDKLNDYFERGIGTITSRTIGKIKAFIDSKKQSNEQGKA